MTDEVRDDRGRFKPGNPGGPGGSRKRPHRLRLAAQEAISEEHMQAMIRKAAAMALQGNLAAMRLVFERTAGRPAEATADDEPLPFTLPELRSAADCEAALEQVMAAFCARTIDRDTAKVLTEMIHVRIKAIETRDLESRLEQMERTAEITRSRDERFL